MNDYTKLPMEDSQVTSTKPSARERFVEAMKQWYTDHRYCEDSWYSCPKNEEGCADDSQGDDCNCGADQSLIAKRQAVEAFADMECDASVGVCCKRAHHSCKCHAACIADLLKEIGL